MIEARLTNDLRFILFDTEKQKEIKSFPKKGIDPEKREKAEASFQETKKKIQQITDGQKAYLKRLFLTGEGIDAAHWRKEYQKNPVLMRIAQLIVWRQGDACFTVRQGNTISWDETAYQIGDAPAITLAHPMEMTEIQVASWQKYYLDNHLKQAFPQVWEPVGFRTEGELSPERYDGCRITVGHILSLEKQDLVHVKYDPESLPEFRFAGSMTITGELAQWGRFLTENGPQNTITLGKIENLQITEPRKLNRVIAYLDRRIILDKIRQDDDAFLGHALTGQTPAQMNEYIRAAADCQAVKCTAVLLEYKSTHFPDDAGMDELTLDW
ncbi:MAG: DUF4132 domain-containing protein [Clostridiales bacterium]|nr:DUF4132 domain-containing protein [Clostridiales bacterium]